MQHLFSGEQLREKKKQLPPCLSSPTNPWENHGGCKIPERSMGRHMDILQFSQQSGGSRMRRKRTSCCPTGTSPGQIT